MSNSNGAFGLRPYGMLGSAPNSTGTTEYRIASDNSNPIFQGMAVIPLAAGVIDDLQAAAGGNVAIVGVFNGCEYVSSTTGEVIRSNTWPGSGADSNFPVRAFLYDNPAQLFTIATSNVVSAANTEAEVRAAVFANIAFATGNSGSTTTGISSAVLDISTAEDTDTSNCVMILGIHEDVSNADHTAAGVSYIVKINNHALNSSDADATAS